MPAQQRHTPVGCDVAAVGLPFSDLLRIAAIEDRERCAATLALVVQATAMPLLVDKCAGWTYSVEAGFLEALLQSEHRTLDPEEAGTVVASNLPVCLWVGQVLLLPVEWRAWLGSAIHTARLQQVEFTCFMGYCSDAHLHTVCRPALLAAQTSSSFRVLSG